ncbi:MAG: hypothetical protein ACPHK1_03855, partial [Pseudohongiellaceae bacterium]
SDLRAGLSISRLKLVRQDSPSEEALGSMYGEEQRCETDKGAYQDKHVVRDDAEHHECSQDSEYERIRPYAFA